MEEAHAKRPNFRGTGSVVGIWAVCRTACTPLGSAQKAATTSRTRGRSHVGLRWRGRNRLLGFWSLKETFWFCISGAARVSVGGAFSQGE